MKILAHESVERYVVQRLRRDGHDVKYVAELSPGILDEDVLALAVDADTLLLTADKDFGELIFRQGYVKQGIVLYRLAGIAADEKERIISLAIAAHGEELLKSFGVITEAAVRIRRV